MKLNSIGVFNRAYHLYKDAVFAEEYLSQGRGKEIKYQDLLLELRGQYTGYCVHLVLIEGCLGSMRDTLIAELEKIPI